MTGAGGRGSGRLEVLNGSLSGVFRAENSGDVMRIVPVPYGLETTTDSC